MGLTNELNKLSTIINYLLNNINVIQLISLLLIGYLIYKLYIIQLNKAVIFGIPVVPADSIFGYTEAIIPNEKGDSHLKLLKIAESNGKLVQFSLLGQTVVMINDKVLAKDALLKITGKGSLHVGNSFLNHRNIFNLDTNEEWQRRRTAFRHAFSQSYVNTQKNIIIELTKKVSNYLNEKADSEEEVEMDELFGRLTVDVICKTAFQLDIGAMEKSTLFQNLHEGIRVQFELSRVRRFPFMHLFLMFPVEPFKSFNKALETTKKFSKFIWNHLQTLDGNNELDSNGLGQAIMNLSKQAGITEEDILSDINLLFIAGHETTAHTLSWFIYSIARNPDIQQLCQQSVDGSTLVEGSGQLPVYVEAVLKESMRKYPVASFGSFRKINDDNGYDIVNCTVDITGQKTAVTKYHLPKGCWIVVNTYILHNSTLNWGIDASKFIPERWLPRSSDRTIDENRDSKENCESNPLSSLAIYGGGGQSREELSFAPFSYGIRNCIGMNLALLEIKLTIFELVRNFTFEIVDESLFDDSKVAESYVTLRPKKKLPLRVYSRKHQMISP